MGRPGQPYISSGTFCVPDYQRGYRWGPDEVRQLLDDIWRNGEEAEASGGVPRDYLLQPVVVWERPDGSWELVDGQQRLTTLFLIAKYIATKRSGVAVEYKLAYETRDPHSSQYLDTLEPSRRDDNIDFHHIAKAYDAIVSWFNTPNQKEGDHRLEAVLKALTTWVYVIWYETRDPDRHALFIRLNRDRIPLTDSELIKAVVLSGSGAAVGEPSRQQEIAAQWDRFEQDLRDDQFWAFVTGSTADRSTRIDFLFETMTPPSPDGSRPRYWTFSKVSNVIRENKKDGVSKFWGDVVERHALLMGWYRNRELYHRIGYLIATGDSIADLIELSQSLTKRGFRDALIERTKTRLGLTKRAVSELSYEDPPSRNKCTEVLLLMNVETVWLGKDPASRFPFHTYSNQEWSLEHINPQHAKEVKGAEARRFWLNDRVETITNTTWSEEDQRDADVLVAIMKDPATATDDRAFQDATTRFMLLFSGPRVDKRDSNNHRLQNLALLQLHLNSKLNNEAFVVKREIILKLDQEGEYILPCTRNVFLKYYTSTSPEQLYLWNLQDQKAYFDKLIKMVDGFLLVDEGAAVEVPLGTEEEGL